MYRLWLMAKVVRVALCKRSTRAFYDGISPVYEAVFVDHITHIEKIVDHLVRTFPEEKRCTVIDIGCGTGLVNKALSKEGFQVTGIDISFRSLQLLKQGDPHLPAINGNANSFPIQNHSIQAIVCLGVWRHIPEPEKVLSEVCRVLHDSGCFLVGYFPPKLGGLFHLRRTRFGKLIACLYSKTLLLFGYYDVIHPDLEAQTLQLMRERFNYTSTITSGDDFHIIFGSQPKDIGVKATRAK